MIFVSVIYLKTKHQQSNDLDLYTTEINNRLNVPESREIIEIIEITKWSEAAIHYSLWNSLGNSEHPLNPFPIFFTEF